MSPQLNRQQVEVTESTRMVTNVGKPAITVCRPPKDKDVNTAMVICPGGGYWNLYWQLEGEEVADWLNSLGITGVILKYRVPRRPDEPKGEPARRPLQDVQRAISLVRSKAGEWGVDPMRIGIIGFSAGGHLALATATRFEQRTYKPVDTIDAVSCRPDFAVLCYSGYLKAKDTDELSPDLSIPAGTPPTFLVHGGADIISDVRHSVVAYLALKRAGIPAELHVYATAAHDFGVRPSDHPCSTWTQSCAHWLRHQGLLEEARANWKFCNGSSEDHHELGTRTSTAFLPAQRHDVPGVRGLGCVGTGIGCAAAGSSAAVRQADWLGVRHAAAGVHRCTADLRTAGGPLYPGRFAVGRRSPAGCRADVRRVAADPIRAAASEHVGVFGLFRRDAATGQLGNVRSSGRGFSAGTGGCGLGCHFPLGAGGMGPVWIHPHRLAPVGRGKRRARLHELGRNSRRNHGLWPVFWSSPPHLPRRSRVHPF